MNSTTIPIQDEDKPSFYHLDNEGNLTWTDEGRRSYRKRFAPFGIRIENITSYEEFRTAMVLSRSAFIPNLLEQLDERCAGKPYHELLTTIMVGSKSDIEKAKRRYETRQKLRVISTPNESKTRR